MELKYVPTIVNDQKDETVLQYYKLNQTMLIIIIKNQRYICNYKLYKL